MSVRCPACKSFDVKKDERWRDAGMAAGAVGGAVCRSAQRVPGSGSARASRNSTDDAPGKRTYRRTQQRYDGTYGRSGRRSCAEARVA